MEKKVYFKFEEYRDLFPFEDVMGISLYAENGSMLCELPKKGHSFMVSPVDDDMKNKFTNKTYYVTWVHTEYIPTGYSISEEIIIKVKKIKSSINHILNSKKTFDEITSKKQK